MSTATLIPLDLIVRGYTTSRQVELEGEDFILRMTPAKAFELAQAILTTLGAM